jgi:hypothetical protein
MQDSLITVDLTIVPGFCNDWPLIEIEANDQLVWKDFVTTESTITLEFLSQNSNTIRIKYINKRNGPDVWDTKIDQDGNILEDQHAILTCIRINGAKIQWLIDSLMWNYVTGGQKQNYGYMDLPGYFELTFPRDVYQWIVEQRQKQSASSSKVSSLDYKNIYIPQHENEMSQQLIQELEQKIKKLNV